MNKQREYIYVLPEDDANRQLANGFVLVSAATQVLRPSGGWAKVVSSFSKHHAPEMRRDGFRYMVLLMDLDEDAGRLNKVKEEIPPDLSGRVFVLGVWSEPERLKAGTGKTYEDIGIELARECRDGISTTDMSILWSHALLKHNLEELKRMAAVLRPILFPAS